MEAERFEEIQEAWLLGLHRNLEAGPFRALSVFDHENLLITFLASEQRAELEAWDERLSSAMGSLDPGAGDVFMAVLPPYTRIWKKPRIAAPKPCVCWRFMCWTGAGS